MSNKADWKLASATSLALLMAGPADASTPEEVTTYVNTVLSIVPDLLAEMQIPVPDQPTARGELLERAEQYATQLAQVSALRVPEPGLQDEHDNILAALKQQEAAARLAASIAPEDAPGTDENATIYAHAAPDTGYARSDTLLARGALQTAAMEYGYTYDGFIATDQPRVDTGTLGSRDAPVTEVAMIQEPIELFGQEAPNIYNFQYDTIYVAANTELTFAFDNRNPTPFTFNFAIYENGSRTDRVTYDQLVAGTDSYAAPHVHTLTVTLKRGVYSYVDNVHPNDMRGLLYVVDENGAVPEPASWAMMVAGFGFTGAAIRRRKGLKA